MQKSSPVLWRLNKDVCVCAPTGIQKQGVDAEDTSLRKRDLKR